MKHKEKIGIVTWLAYYNYGTALQAFALQHIISELGYYVATISDENIIKHYSPYNSKPLYFKLLRQIKYLIHSLLKNKDEKTRENEYTNSFNSFYKKHMNIDHRLTTKSYPYDYDIMFCGSDQIWSPYYPINQKYYNYFYLGWFKGKKIAYAPSINLIEKESTDYIHMITPWLEEFSSLSAREKSGADILSKITGKEIQTVIDPTLLLPGEDWVKSFNLKKDGQKYILCYFLTYNETYIQKVIEFAASVNLPIRFIITDKRFRGKGEQDIYAGPVEFLQEIYNSSFLFTDSFHGSIFAIHFKKEFRTFQRFKNRTNNNQNQRITNLFKMFGIGDLYIDTDNIAAPISHIELNYNKIYDMLDCERKKSLEYILYSINN